MQLVVSGSYAAGSTVGRMDPKYSTEQREAITRRIVDDGLSAPAAVKEAGELGLYDLPRFEMPVSTAQDLARKARARRRNTDLTPLAKDTEPDDALDVLARRWVSLFDRETSRLEAQENTEKGVDHVRLRALVREGRELRQLVRRAPPVRQGKARATEETGALLAELAKEARAGSRAATSTPTQGEQRANGHSPPTSSDEGQRA